MIDQMQPNFMRKQIGFITDRALEECAWPCLVRQSVSPDEYLVNLPGFGRIALAPAEPSREQVRDRSRDPTEHPARTAPLDCALAPDVKSNSLADWVREIRKVWTRGPASTLELARVVSEARNALPHGGWSSLWKHPSSMPFAKRTGYALLVIAAGLGWANVRTFAHLPAGWSILFELAKLDRTTLERLIEEEVVKPTLTLSEAKELVAQLRGKTLNKKSPRTNLRERLRRFENFLRAILPHCSPAEKQLARATLARLIEQIDTAAECDCSPILIKMVA